MSRHPAASATAAAACLAAAAALAWHHPIAALPAVAAVGAAALWSALRPGVWILVLPACLPWLNFAPWTGWLAFDEFDLLLLAMLGGAFAGMAWQGRGAPRDTAGPPDRLAGGLLLATGLLGAVALLRGLQDAGGDLGWFQGYGDPMNTLRVGKSLLYALLCWPLLGEALRRDATLAARRLAWGMAAGLTVVVLAVVWERLASPGLWNFRRVYRAIALFWEMHVGGAAIDAYLALALPFCLWLLRAARGPLLRLAAMGLGLLTVYACLMTFSRGVYAALLVGVAVVALCSLQRPRAADTRTPPPPTPSTEPTVPKVLNVPNVRVTPLPPTPSAASAPAAPSARARRGGRLLRLYLPLALALALLLAGVLGPRSFMTQRLLNTDAVLDGRWEHWRAAAALLESPADLLFGIGLGRFPARYERATEGVASAGRVRWQGAAGGGAQEPAAFVSLYGPVIDPDLEGLFALTQRVPIQPGQHYRVEFDARADFPSPLAIEVCERHLLYDRLCQGFWLGLPDTRGRWTHHRLMLRGPAFAASRWYAPRLGMLAFNVPDIGGRVDIANVRLRAGEGPELLANGNFKEGMARWFPAAQYHFLPWHTDSLYLEVLVERGLAALLVLLALVALAVRRLARAPQGPAGLRACCLAALASAMLLGAVSSVMDVPRVAWLFWLLLLFSLRWPPAREKGTAGGVVTPAV